MSELFGHEKGAFTGATRAHAGKFELADNGTLFMDEVTDLPLSVQASLLRVLQQGEVVRVGGEKTMVVNARVIAASNKELTELVPGGGFRLDLYYRLCTIVLRMPPLRERPSDIEPLAREIAEELGQKYARPAPPMSDAVTGALMAHAWPGNIRELRNIVERMFLMPGGGRPTRAWVEDLLATDRPMGDRLAATPAHHLSLAAKRARLQAVLRRHKDNKTATAQELGVTRKTIHKWLRK
jgi:transcriptional regulator with PAS, ATPase and Fis domain